MFNLNVKAAFLTQTVALDDATVKFEIWDTAGQERYRSLAPMYYRGAAAAIIVYDITNPDSFAGAKSWVKELQRRGDTNVVIAMVSCRETSRTSWYWDGASHFIKLSLNVTLYHKSLHHFTRREIKQISSLVGK